MPVYECKPCLFKSPNKTDHTRHVKTRKHLTAFRICHRCNISLSTQCKFDRHMMSNACINVSSDSESRLQSDRKARSIVPLIKQSIVSYINSTTDISVVDVGKTILDIIMSTDEYKHLDTSKSDAAIFRYTMWCIEAIVAQVHSLKLTHPNSDDIKRFISFDNIFDSALIKPYQNQLESPN